MARPTDRTIKRLLLLSGNRCAFPKCHTALVQPNGSIVGEVCHVRAANPDGPRFDPHQGDDERHGFGNLILMCGVHHKVIDDDEESYPGERLLRMKAKHEAEATNAPPPSVEAVDRFVASFVGSTIYGGVTINQGVPAAPVPRGRPKLSISFGSSAGDRLGDRMVLVPIFANSTGTYVRRRDSVTIRTENNGQVSARDLLWTFRFPRGVFVYSGPGHDLAHSGVGGWIYRPTVITTRAEFLHAGMSISHTYSFSLEGQSQIPIDVSVVQLDEPPLVVRLTAEVAPFLAEILARRDDQSPAEADS